MVWPVMVVKFAQAKLAAPVLVTQTFPNWLLTTTLPPATLIGTAAVPMLSAPVVAASNASSSRVPVVRRH